MFCFHTWSRSAFLWVAIQTSQETQFLKKKHEMRQVDDALQLMKEAYRERMEACDERQAHLEFKQAKMREQVAKFEKFIHENDAKRQRAGMPLCVCVFLLP